MDDDRRRWDDRWRDQTAPEPCLPDVLVGREHLIPARGRALDVACGLGATAVSLAQRGLDVVGIDVSAVAVEVAEQLAEWYGMSATCRFRRGDLDGGIDEEGPFDIVVCQRFRDPRLYPRLVDLLAPGGLLAITVLSVVDRADRSSPFLAAPGELATAFGHLDVLHSIEADGEASLVARAN